MKNKLSMLRLFGVGIAMMVALITNGLADATVDANKKALQDFAAKVKAEGDDYSVSGAEADALLEAAGATSVEEGEYGPDADFITGLGPEANEAFSGTVFPATSGYTTWLVHNLWILLAAALVFIMHLGFATLESGLTQSKNTVNILFKNVFIISMGIITYYLIGFNTHYPSGWIVEGWLSLGGPVSVAGSEATLLTSLYNSSYPVWTDFIFQAMFAATAATIVSGAVAERIKLPSFMVYATILVAFIYPIIGAWHWGGGWLSGLANDEGFYDFAGSTVVHAFGGFSALAAVLVLGPRKGKYTKSGIKPIIGHSAPLATIGVFLLWLGWFGFNGGSVLSADGASVGLVFTTTAMAAAGGAIAAIFVAWAFLKKPDLSMGLNGILAGLVGITAGADSISVFWSLIVGAIAGALVVFSIIFFDRAKIDDPVGAISVHGVCGIWGTIAVGIFGGKDLVAQIIGALAVSAVAFVLSFIVISIVKAVMGIRVSEEEEAAGLDVEEHGSPAYHLN